MNPYEIAILYDPDLEIDLEKATSRVEKILADAGAKINNTDNWGKRKLAYPIKKHETAIYVFYSVEMPADANRKIENALNITDEVIRFLVTKVDVKAIAKAEQAKAAKAKRAAERGENAEEESESESEGSEE